MLTLPAGQGPMQTFSKLHSRAYIIFEISFKILSIFPPCVLPREANPLPSLSSSFIVFASGKHCSKIIIWRVERWLIWLRTLAALVEDSCLVPVPTSGSSKLSLTPVPGNLQTSTGTCTNVVPISTHPDPHTYTENKIVK